MAADFITDVKTRTLEVKTGAKIGGNLDVGNIIRAQKMILSGRDLCDLVTEIERQLENIQHLQQHLQNTIPTSTTPTITPQTHINSSELTEIRTELTGLRTKIGEIIATDKLTREQELDELRSILRAIQQKSTDIQSELTLLANTRIADLENIVKTITPPIPKSPTNIPSLDEFNFQLRAGISAATEIFERSLNNLDKKIEANYFADNHIRDKVEKMVTEINHLEQQIVLLNQTQVSREDEKEIRGDLEHFRNQMTELNSKCIANKFDDTILISRIAEIETKLGEISKIEKTYDDSEIRCELVKLSEKVREIVSHDCDGYNQNELNLALINLETKFDEKIRNELLKNVSVVYDDSEIRGELIKLSEKIDEIKTYDDNEIRGELIKLSEKIDEMKTYDDSEIREKLSEFSDKIDNVSKYDDSEIRHELVKLDEKIVTSVVYNDSEIREELVKLSEKLAKQEQSFSQTITYDDTQIRTELTQLTEKLQNVSKYDDTQIRTEILELTNKLCGFSIYDDTDIRQELLQLSQKLSGIKSYDDTEIRQEYAKLLTRINTDGEDVNKILTSVIEKIEIIDNVNIREELAHISDKIDRNMHEIRNEMVDLSGRIPSILSTEMKSDVISSNSISCETELRELLASAEEKIRQQEESDKNIIIEIGKLRATFSEKYDNIAKTQGQTAVSLTSLAAEAAKKLDIQQLNREMNVMSDNIDKHEKLISDLTIRGDNTQNILAKIVEDVSSIVGVHRLQLAMMQKQLNDVSGRVSSVRAGANMTRAVVLANNARLSKLKTDTTSNVVGVLPTPATPRAPTPPTPTTQHVPTTPTPATPPPIIDVLDVVNRRLDEFESRVSTDISHAIATPDDVRAMVKSIDATISLQQQFVSNMQRQIAEIRGELSSKILSVNTEIQSLRDDIIRRTDGGSGVVIAHLKQLQKDDVIEIIREELALKSENSGTSSGNLPSREDVERIIGHMVESHAPRKADIASELMKLGENCERAMTKGISNFKHIVKLADDISNYREQLTQFQTTVRMQNTATHDSINEINEKLRLHETLLETKSTEIDKFRKYIGEFNGLRDEIGEIINGKFGELGQLSTKLELAFSEIETDFTMLRTGVSTRIDTLDKRINEITSISPPTDNTRIAELEQRITEIRKSIVDMNQRITEFATTAPRVRLQTTPSPPRSVSPAQSPSASSLQLPKPGIAIGTFEKRDAAAMIEKKFAEISVLLPHEIHIAPTGDDTTGNGTIFSPYKSICRVLEMYETGELTAENMIVLLIHPGVYTEDIVIRFPKICLRGYPDNSQHTVIIHGSITIALESQYITDGLINTSTTAKSRNHHVLQDNIVNIENLSVISRYYVGDADADGKTAIIELRGKVDTLLNLTGLRLISSAFAPHMATGCFGWYQSETGVASQVTITNCEMILDPMNVSMIPAIDVGGSSASRNMTIIGTRINYTNTNIITGTPAIRLIGKINATIDDSVLRTYGDNVIDVSSNNSIINLTMNRTTIENEKLASHGIKLLTGRTQNIDDIITITCVGCTFILPARVDIDIRKIPGPPPNNTIFAASDRGCMYLFANNNFGFSERYRTFANSHAVRISTNFKSNPTALYHSDFTNLRTSQKAALAAAFVNSTNVKARLEIGLDE